MVRERLPANAAYALLRRRAMDERRTIDEVAQIILEKTGLNEGKRRG